MTDEQVNIFERGVQLPTHGKWVDVPGSPFQVRTLSTDEWGVIRLRANPELWTQPLMIPEDVDEQRHADSLPPGAAYAMVPKMSLLAYSLNASITMEMRAHMRYRVGTKLGRTIYRIEDDEAWGDGTLIGVMDTPQDAALVVQALHMLTEMKKLLVPGEWVTGDDGVIRLKEAGL